MLCISCGSELPEGAAFCSLCGSRVGEGEEEAPSAPQPPVRPPGARTRPGYPDFQRKGRGWMVALTVGVVLVTLAGTSTVLAIFVLRLGWSGGHSEVREVDTAT